MTGNDNTPPCTVHTTTPDPAWTPAVLGFGFQTRTGKAVLRGKLHHGTEDATPEGVVIRCSTDFGLRIAQPEAVLPPIGKFAGTHRHLLLGALATLDLPPERLCLGCFGQDLITAYGSARADGSLTTLVEALTWEHDTAQAQRTITVSAAAAAVIAHQVAFTDDRRALRPGNGTVEPGATHTVTLNGHADAVICGLVGPQDLGKGTEADDRARVWYQGIHAPDSTWAQVHAAFPLSLCEDVDLSLVDTDATWDEIRREFPLPTFRAWADTTIRLRHTTTEPDGFTTTDPMTEHFYDPEAGL